MVHHRSLTILVVVAFILIFSTVFVQAERPDKPGKPGMDACLAKVDELEQIIAEQQATIEALLDAYKNYAPVMKTGQTKMQWYGDDAVWQRGVEPPVPRFTNNGDGTVTDNLTRSVWLEDANCFGEQSWIDALDLSNDLKAGDCGLTDGSVKGDWRLPNRNELLSLVDIETGDVHMADVTAFRNVIGSSYHTSSTMEYNYPAVSYDVSMAFGTSCMMGKNEFFYVWPVRDPK